MPKGIDKTATLDLARRPRSKYKLGEMRIGDFFYVNREMESAVRSAVCQYQRRWRKKNPRANLLISVRVDGGKILVMRRK